MLEDDERGDHLAANLVRPSGHARLGNGRVLEEGGLDLDRADSVGGDLDHLVRPAGDPDVAVLVDVRRVAGPVDDWPGIRSQ